MVRIAANLSTLFTEHPILDRPARAAEAGFRGVEMSFPYDAPAQDLRDRIGWAGVPMLLINAPPPNYAGGEPGWAAVPGLQARFQRDLERTLRYARVLGPTHLHLMSGATDARGARATLVENLRHAGTATDGFGLTIEVINRDDRPGYYLSDFDLALEIIEEAAVPTLGLQFDTWHAHRITGDLLGTWDRVRARVTHVQIGALEDRGEPDGPVLDFVERIAGDGWDGWVAAEYRPRAGTEAGLGWLAPFR